MGTRSIVAAEFDDGIKGVYVHWDGYPEGRLPQLTAMIVRDGVEKVIETIVGTPGGWSQLEADNDGELSSSYRDGRFIAVPGYGVRYSPEEGDKHYRTPGDGGEEYFYVIRRNGTIEWVEGDWPTSSKKIKVHRVGDALPDDGASSVSTIDEVPSPADGSAVIIDAAVRATGYTA